MDLAAMTIQGGALIGAILLLRVLGRYRLPAWTFRILWGVALARLLIPAALPFPWNVYTALERLLAPAETGQAVSIPSQTAAPSPGLPALSPEPVPAVEPAAGLEIPWLTLLWLAGAVLLAAVFLAGYRRGLRRFRTALPFRHPAVEVWRRRHPRLEGVPVRTCAYISSPLTYGLFRPVILLPPGLEEDSGEELGYVLLHEGAHILNRDAWWKLLLAAALCVHWFNPLVWCMYLCANRDLERCCDEQVVRACGLDARGAYALTLLKWEERRGGFRSLSSGLGAPELKERVTSIMKLRKPSAAALALAAVLVLGTTVAFATSPVQEQGETGTSAPSENAGSSALVPYVFPVYTEELLQAIDEGHATGAFDPQDVLFSFLEVFDQEKLAGSAMVQRDSGFDYSVLSQEESSVRFLLKRTGTGERLLVQMQKIDYKETTGLWQVTGYQILTTEAADQMPENTTVSGTASEADLPIPVEEALPGGDYPKNQRGETYGSVIYQKYAGHYPDLIAVQADNDKSGYVLSSDNDGTYHYPGTLDTEDEASVAAWKEWLKTQANIQYIPVYDAERETVVGLWTLYNPLGYDIQQPLLEVKMAAVEEALKNELGWDSGEIASYIQSMREEYVSNGWDGEESKTYIQNMRQAMRQKNAAG